LKDDKKERYEKYKCIINAIEYNETLEDAIRYLDKIVEKGQTKRFIELIPYDRNAIKTVLSEVEKSQKNFIKACTIEPGIIDLDYKNIKNKIDSINTYKDIEHLEEDLEIYKETYIRNLYWKHLQTKKSIKD